MKRERKEGMERKWKAMRMEKHEKREDRKRQWK
jgi:hypothetical protein